METNKQTKKQTKKLQEPSAGQQPLTEMNKETEKAWCIWAMSFKSKAESLYNIDKYRRQPNNNRTFPFSSRLKGRNQIQISNAA